MQKAKTTAGSSLLCQKPLGAPASSSSDLCFPPPCRVLQLMNLTDSRLAQAGNEKLELAMLSFFEQFRKIYIGDQVQKSSKVISFVSFAMPSAVVASLFRMKAGGIYETCLLCFLDVR